MAGGQRQTSEVRKFLEREDHSQVVCSLCKFTLRFHGGTSSMRELLRRKHPVESESVASNGCPKKQLKMDNYSKKCSCSNERAAAISNLIAGMILKDLHPINVVNRKGFQELMAYLEPGYKLPSGTHFTNLIKKIYGSVNIKSY